MESVTWLLGLVVGFFPDEWVTICPDTDKSSDGSQANSPRQIDHKRAFDLHLSRLLSSYFGLSIAPIHTCIIGLDGLTKCHNLTDNLRMALPEDELLLREGKKIVEALGKTLSPLVEVVLHDYTRPEEAVVFIANNLSGRQAGEPVTEIGIARIQDPNFPAVLQNYPNRFPDGRPAKSTSIGLKNSAGRFVGAICLNIDISMLSAVAASIGQLVQTDVSPTRINESLAPKSVEAVRAYLEKFAARHNTTPRALSLNQRRAAMSELESGGLLNLKNAISEVADTLGVARSTAYTYLPRESAKMSNLS